MILTKLQPGLLEKTRKLLKHWFVESSIQSKDFGNILHQVGGCLKFGTRRIVRSSFLLAELSTGERPTTS